MEEDKILMALKHLYNALSGWFGVVAPPQPHETVALHLVRLKRVWRQQQFVAGLAGLGLLVCASSFSSQPTPLALGGIGGSALIAVQSLRRARAISVFYKGLRRRTISNLEANVRYAHRYGLRLSPYLPQMEEALQPLGLSFKTLSVGAVHRLPDSAFQLFPDQVHGYERYVATAGAELNLAPKKKAPHWGPSQG